MSKITDALSSPLLCTAPSGTVMLSQQGGSSHFGFWCLYVNPRYVVALATASSDSGKPRGTVKVSIRVTSESLLTNNSQRDIPAFTIGMLFNKSRLLKAEASIYSGYLPSNRLLFLFYFLCFVLGERHTHFCTKYIAAVLVHIRPSSVRDGGGALRTLHFTANLWATDSVRASGSHCLQLWVHCWPSQTPIDSSSPEDSQTAPVKANASGGQTHNLRIWERDWWGWYRGRVLI